jgi:serine/threonine-protein kinase
MNLCEGDDFDHYQIRTLIARGSVADVYRAFDILSGREVALKIPWRSVVLDAARYEQFLRELEAMHLLQHPAVQSGIESGRYNGTPYLVTEWIEGKSLRKLVNENGPLPIDRAVTVTRKIAAGLAYCHEQGVVHRDVKPDNVLILNEDHPVVIDFGLASTPSRPGPGKAAGTPGYVAPEQIEGQGVTNGLMFTRLVRPCMTCSSVSRPSPVKIPGR